MSRSKALFRNWLKQRRQEGRITTEDWEKCRIIRLLEAIDAPDLIWDQRLRQAEPWIWHPFANLAEPEKRVLHLTARLPEASSKRNSDAVRPRRPIERERLARLVDKASLHAVDRYFQQIRRELAGLERGIAVASNRRRIWYGYSPYDGSMIQRHLDIHRAYYNFVQVGEDGLTRAQRFGLARGKIRYQDIVYYR